MGVGHHEAAWRLPESDPYADLDVEHYKNLARIAERGKLDSLFLADSPVLWDNIGRRPAGTLEPTVLLTALAGGDRAHRPDRHRLDHLQRAVQPGAPVRLARPHQRRPRRLEHRHHRRASTPPATSTSTTCRRTASATSAPPSSSTSRSSSGTAGTTTPSLGDKDDAASGATTTRSTRRAHAGEYFRVAGALNVPRSAAGPPAARAGRLVGGRQGASPRATPRRCSPRSRRSRTGRRSTPTSSARAAGARPRPRPRSRSCPASCR